MNTDNYDFEKSSLPQDLDGYTPFLDKQANTYINDQNSGVYSASQSLVQFDLSSLYNSSKFTNTADAFITIPIVMVYALSTATAGDALLNVPGAGWALQTLKSGYHHLIHQADLQIDGKTISETQPFLGTFTHIKLLSEMSQNDLKSIGTAIGFSDVLDTPSGIVYGTTTSTVAGASGNGLANNLVFGHSTQPLSTTAGPGAQNVAVCNEAINKRALKVVDTTTKTNYNTIFNTANGIVNPDLLASNDFKSTFSVDSTGKYGIVKDLAIIRLKDIFDCMNNIGLVKKFSGVLRLYINTGSLSLTCAGDAAVPSYSFSVANSNFSNVCPFTINNLGVNAAAGGLTAGALRVNAGLFIAKALATNLGPVGVNLANSVASHSMQACRLYYSSIQLEPEKALAYSRANQAKNVVFRNYYFNQINSVGATANYSQLIQSGIINPYALIVVPYISSSAGSTVGYQWQSPFDTAPATGSPCILENLQVQLGGQQVLNSSYNYGFETFLTQYANSEALSSSDFGVSCGVVSKEWWEMNRVYYVNLSRSTRADQMTPRNIVLSFKNSSRVAIDVKVFTVYLDRIVLNVDTGAVTR